MESNNKDKVEQDKRVDFDKLMKQILVSFIGMFFLTFSNSIYEKFPNLFMIVMTIISIIVVMVICESIKKSRFMQIARRIMIKESRLMQIASWKVIKKFPFLRFLYNFAILIGKSIRKIINSRIMRFLYKFILGTIKFGFVIIGIFVCYALSTFPTDIEYLLPTYIARFVFSLFCIFSIIHIIKIRHC